MATKRPTIDKIIVKVETDIDADFSDYLGEYASTLGPDDRTIDREERGDMGRGEHRYFVAAMSGEQTGNADSVEQDYQRAEAYNRGEWCMVGVYAVANIRIHTPQGGYSSIQTIRTPGLWGIESDSTDDYIAEEAQG